MCVMLVIGGEREAWVVGERFVEFSFLSETPVTAGTTSVALVDVLLLVPLEVWFAVELFPA